MNKYLKLYESHSQYVNPEIRPNVSYCKLENEVHYNPRTWADEYFTIESTEDNNTIYLKALDSSITKTVSVSTDNGATWAEYTSSTGGSGTTLATLNSGDKLLVKGENSTYATSSSKYNYFTTTGQFKVYGNIMSLVNGDSFANADELTDNYTFDRLFYQCIGLISAENLVLPATTLTTYCYYQMFHSCTSLTVAPELPAIILAQGCYYNMFRGCTSLTTAPKLPSTTLAQSCYYGMFFGCTSLTTAPELPATTLVTECYCVMFRNCTSLNSITCLATDISATSCTQNWVNGVALNGTFYKNPSMTTSNWGERGPSSIQTGWTIQDAA